MTRKKIIIKTLWFLLCISIIVTAPLLIAFNTHGTDQHETAKNMITVWQIDSFEGGKGSRASYLQNIGNEFSKVNDCYVQVISLSSEAARQNLSLGTVPDLISYGAGTYGLEQYITKSPVARVWAHGSYCFLAVDEAADFSDISVKNTVVDGGVENFAKAAALLSGIGGAPTEKPTGAYVSLINNKYKYMLGSQRDIFRLTARGVSFKIKPVVEFNDLYQLISVTAQSEKNCFFAQKFTDFLLNNEDNLFKIGLMGANKLYDNEMSDLEGLEYNYKLTSPISKTTKDSLDKAINNSNVTLLKNLLK